MFKNPIVQFTRTLKTIRYRFNIVSSNFKRYPCKLSFDQIKTIGENISDILNC